mgnify:FL=1
MRTTDGQIHTIPVNPPLPVYDPWEMTPEQQETMNRNFNTAAVAGYTGATARAIADFATDIRTRAGGGGAGHIGIDIATGGGGGAG